MELNSKAFGLEEDGVGEEAEEAEEEDDEDIDYDME